MTKNISDELTLQCPLYGSYIPFSVEWEHKIGIDTTIVRKLLPRKLLLQRYRTQTRKNMSALLDFIPVEGHNF